MEMIKVLKGYKTLSSHGLLVNFTNLISQLVRKKTALSTSYNPNMDSQNIFQAIGKKTVVVSQRSQPTDSGLYSYNIAFGMHKINIAEDEVTVGTHKESSSLKILKGNTKC